MSSKVTCYEVIPGAPQAVGPYSPATRCGSTIFISGQVGLNPDSGQLVGPGIEEQTSQVLSNLRAVLTELKLTFKNVAKTTVFLTDLGHFQTVNRLYAEALQGHKPARSTIQVAALPLGAIVEIEMTAFTE